MIRYRQCKIDTLYQNYTTVDNPRQMSYPPCAFPASIPLILGIGTGAVQGRYQKTRLDAGFSIGNWVLFIDFGQGILIVVVDRRSCVAQHPLHFVQRHSLHISYDFCFLLFGERRQPRSKELILFMKKDDKL